MPVYLLNYSRVLIQRLEDGSAVSAGAARGEGGDERPNLFLLPAACVAVNSARYRSDERRGCLLLPPLPHHRGNGPHPLPPICPEWAHPAGRPGTGGR